MDWKERQQIIDASKKRRLEYKNREADRKKRAYNAHKELYLQRSREWQREHKERANELRKKRYYKEKEELNKIVI